MLELKSFDFFKIMSKKKFYITTSIFYANALPHIGSALETVQADVLARYNRNLGKQVFFLTGTDEHGKKVAGAAGKAGKSPEKFTNEVSSCFKKLTKALNLSNNDFIRTTDKKRHWPSVKKAWLELEKKGDIYKKKYKGFYCLGCEAFITKKDLKNNKCIFHQKKPEIVEEENYFFRLSKYSKQIQEIIKKNKIKIVPESRKNEMANFAAQGLEDVSFSRPRKDLKWAIPVPGDSLASVYVWLDALMNYVSIIGYADDKKRFNELWPADIHCIGKDIQKFHCLIWPGILLSLGIALPKTIFIHGFISVAGQKMSKSLGNVISPFELVNRYGADPVRYFLLREILPTEDGDFTYQKFEQRYNSDLAKGLGNLVARVIALSIKFKVKTTKIKNNNLKLAITNSRKKYKKAMQDFKFNEVLAAVWQLIGFCDKYIEKKKPWQESGKQKEVIGDLLSAIIEIAELLNPFLPETSKKILEQLKNKKNHPLFPRLNI
jgi:methionyl-tRNA synthetase